MTDAVQHDPRIRPRPGLPLFPTIAPIPVAACRTDKLEVTVAGTVEYQMLNHLSDVIHLMSSAENGRHPRDRVLNAANRSGWRQAINKENWLVSGHLKYRGRTERQCSVVLELTVNPTRYAEHCHQTFAPSSVEELASISPSQRLRKRPDVVAAIGQSTHDGKDNIMSYTRWTGTASQDWPALVVQYIEAVCRLVEGDFNAAAAGQYPIDPPRMRFHSLTSAPPGIGLIEQHVDFMVQDARRSYRQFSDGLWDAAVSIRETTLPRRQDRGRQVSAHWTTVVLKEHLELKVYTKANCRLRVEIAYGGVSARGPSIRQLLMQGRWPTDASFTDQLEAIRLDALDRIQRVVAVVEQQPAPSPVEPAETFVQLMVALSSSRLSGGAAQEVLRGLLDEGSVGGPAGSPVARVAEALLRRQLLERVSIVPRAEHPRFRPTARLHSLLERLRQQD